MRAVLLIVLLLTPFFGVQGYASDHDSVLDEDSWLENCSVYRALVADLYIGAVPLFTAKADDTASTVEVDSFEVLGVDFPYVPDISSTRVLSSRAGDFSFALRNDDGYILIVSRESLTAIEDFWDEDGFDADEYEGDGLTDTAQLTQRILGGRSTIEDVIVESFSVTPNMMRCTAKSILPDMRIFMAISYGYAAGSAGLEARQVLAAKTYNGYAELSSGTLYLASIGSKLIKVVLFNEGEVYSLEYYIPTSETEFLAFVVRAVVQASRGTGGGQ